jgi:signal transduction histidine kinase
VYVNFDLKNLINELVKLFEIQARMKGIKIQLLYSKELPVNVVSDPNRIRQIIINLLSNSMKFTLSGSIKIEVELECIDPSMEIITTPNYHLHNSNDSLKFK